jgi:hypothetical protein
VSASFMYAAFQDHRMEKLGGSDRMPRCGPAWRSAGNIALNPPRKASFPGCIWGWQSDHFGKLGRQRWAHRERRASREKCRSLQACVARGGSAPGPLGSSRRRAHDLTQQRTWLTGVSQAQLGDLPETGCRPWLTPSPGSDKVVPFRSFPPPLAAPWA